MLNLDQTHCSVLINAFHTKKGFKRTIEPDSLKIDLGNVTVEGGAIILQDEAITTLHYFQAAFDPYYSTRVWVSVYLLRSSPMQVYRKPKPVMVFNYKCHFLNLVREERNVPHWSRTKFWGGTMILRIAE
jgi:hypothetical protein